MRTWTVIEALLWRKLRLLVLLVLALTFLAGAACGAVLVLL